MWIYKLVDNIASWNYLQIVLEVDIFLVRKGKCCLEVRISGYS